MEKSPTHSQLQLIVVTPEATVLDETAEFVALPLFDGEIGIAPLHSPMIGRLGYGEMRVRNDGRTHRYYVDGGFVQVVGSSGGSLRPSGAAASPRTRPGPVAGLRGSSCRMGPPPQRFPGAPAAVDRSSGLLCPA